ncbi:MAG: hypothetical protein NVSMB57_08180 [Actinomycetota bacterium]
MRVLCAAVSGPGHAYPMLAVAHGLRSRGHDVVVALEERHRAAAHGFELIAFPSLPASHETQFRPFSIAGRIAERFAPLLDVARPDVAVIDLLALGVALACDMREVPWASLSVHPLHLPSRDLAPFGNGRAPARTQIGRAFQRRAQQRQLLSFRQGMDECNEVRERLNLQRIERIDLAISESLLLVATLPALEPHRSDWPENAHIVGPCLFEPPSVDPGDPEGSGPLVLVAASTAHEGALLHAAAEAVTRLGLRAIVTTGATTGASLKSSPRLRVVAEAPHGTIAGRVDAIVCNGGHGIVARALTAGVPFVVLPQHGDQKENGARAARTGAAIMVTKPRHVAAALARVLEDPRFKLAARSVAKSARGLDGGRTSAEMIETWAHGHHAEKQPAQKQREAGKRPPPSRTEA